jgi:hypothetical protein
MDLVEFLNARIAALKPVAEFLASPEGHAAVEWAAAARNIPDCHCLCAVNHPGALGVCQGESSAVEEALFQTVNGDRWVQMCKPCATARRERVWTS